MNIKVYATDESIRALGKDLEQMSQQIQEKAKAALQVLATQVHGFIVQEATTSLHSTKDLFIKNLVGPMEAGENIWVVGLKKEAEWIEEGYDAYNMLPNLLKGPKAKIAKDGHRYNIIPFKHNKPPSQSSRTEIQLANYVKNELKARGLDKVLKGPDGRPLSGKVAKVDLTGPGSPKSIHGTHLLSGLTIYQTVKTNAAGKDSVRRDIMTFRVASEKQNGTGKWYNHGLPGANIFQKVHGQVDAAWAKMIQELLVE